MMARREGWEMAPRTVDRSFMETFNHLVECLSSTRRRQSDAGGAAYTWDPLYMEGQEVPMQAKLLTLLTAVLMVPLAQAGNPPPLQAKAPVQVSAEPKRFDLLAVDPDRHRLLAAHSQAGTLSIVDTAAGKLEREIAVGDKPSGVAVDTADGKYFVGTLTGVSFIDSKTLEKSGFVATSGPTDAMVYADGKLYVGHDDGSELWVIDVKSAKLTASIAIPGVPEIADADGKRLYQNIKDKNEVVVIDLGTAR